MHGIGILLHSENFAFSSPKKLPGFLLLFGSAMPVDQTLRRGAFQKLDRQLTRLAKKTAPENIHKFRTYGRRIEALLDGLAAKLSRNDRKLLKLLARLRKKAGRTRDLDVQISALQNLKIPQASSRKAQLLQLLMDERARRERKLEKTFDTQTVAELRKRLKRTNRELQIPAVVSPLQIALRQFSELPWDRNAVSEKVLHQYRICGKRARYLAELEGKNAAAQRTVEQLKRMQDVVGDWHDWLKLSQRAEALFGGVQESSLVAALRNITRAKFRSAVGTVIDTQAALRGTAPVAVEAAPKRPQSSDSRVSAAAA